MKLADSLETIATCTLKRGRVPSFYFMLDYGHDAIAQAEGAAQQYSPCCGELFSDTGNDF
jgi:hypothetical protein